MCQSGLEEEDQKEYHWKIDQEQAAKEAMNRCVDIKHTFQRIARDCADATFLSVMVRDRVLPREAPLHEIPLQHPLVCACMCAHGGVLHSTPRTCTRPTQTRDPISPLLYLSNSPMQVNDDPSPETSALCDELGVDVLPTLQFWRNGSKLWEHRGEAASGGRPLW